MAGQAGHLGQARVLPHHDLVLAVAVRADQLVAVAAPGQVAHLAARVHLLHQLARARVPELDAPVRGAAAAGQERTLVRRPRDRLDRGRVLAQLVERGRVDLAPHQQLVVVAAGGQLPVLGVPFEPADLLLVAGQSPQVLVRAPHVAVQDAPIPRAGRQNVIVPRQRPSSRGVAGHGPKSATLLGVPDLDEPLVGADREMRATLDPRHRRDAIVLQLAQFRHAPGGRVPHVDAVSQSHPKDVAAAPVHKIEVKVVGQVGRVEDFKGHLADSAWRFPRAEEEPLAVETDRGEAVDV